MQSKKIVTLTALTLVLALMFATATQTFATTVTASNQNYSGVAPKYVFLFIGDGMSSPQISSAEMYLGKMTNANTIKSSNLSFTKFPTAGIAQTYDSTSFIPDSASTATSIASGKKTLSGVLNMDETKTKQFTPITELLNKKGYKIGIISSVPINHATPAAFYSKAQSRGEYYNIALQLAKSGFDFYGGGGFLRPTDKEKDKKHIYEVLKENGYTLADSKEKILALSNKDKKVVAINPKLSVDNTSMPYEIDRKEDELSLADFVKKGIDVLDNDKGFFMMTEAGKIDWAGHANDSAASIQDTIAFSDSIQVAVDFYNKHPKETLIIVTGDHECGGMSIGFAGTGYSTFFDKIDKVKMSSTDGFAKTVVGPYQKSKNKYNASLADFEVAIANNFGLVFPTAANAEQNKEMVLTDAEMDRLQQALAMTMTPRDQRNYSDQEKVMYGYYDPLSVTLIHIVNNKAGIQYTSYSHTGLPCPVFAIGAGHELFGGYYDNTDIFHKMANILNVK